MVINELTDVGFLMIGVDIGMLVYVGIISLEFVVTASYAGVLASVWDGAVINIDVSIDV